MAFVKGGLISMADMNEMYLYEGLIQTPVIGTAPITLGWIPKLTLGDDSESWEHIFTLAPYETVEVFPYTITFEGGSSLHTYEKTTAEVEWTEVDNPIAGEVTLYTNDNTEFKKIKFVGKYVDGFGFEQFKIVLDIAGNKNPAATGEKIRIFNEDRTGYTTGAVTRTLANQARLGV